MNKNEQRMYYAKEKHNTIIIIHKKNDLTTKKI